MAEESHVASSALHYAAKAAKMFIYYATPVGTFARVLRFAEHAVFAVVLYKSFRRVASQGLFKTIGKTVLSFVTALPGASSLLDKQLDQEVASATKNLLVDPFGKSFQFSEIPDKGLPSNDILAKLGEMKKADIDSHEGKAWAYVYSQVESGFDDFLAHASNIFMHENALNPMAFPALRKMENDIVRMSLNLLNGDRNTCGTLTSGGTESILMAVKAHRDRARKLRNVSEPNMVLCITAHPAFEKAAHYFGVEARHAPVISELDDPRVDIPALEKLIDSNTIMIVGSAPQYPHGVVDDIAGLGDLALRKDIPLHVDACVGGFILPWMRILDPSLPAFDFSVSGVASISADIHKYGFASKGSSVVLYRSEEFRQYQFFSYAEWPGGLFGSPSMCGSRGGGPIAAAWACLLNLGKDGYLRTAKIVLDTARKLAGGVNAIPGLRVIGNPKACLVSFLSQDPAVDILAVADVMETKGWKIERQRKPSSIHLSVMPAHAKIADRFLQDLATSVTEVRSNKQLAKEGTAAMYGMIAQIPDERIVESFIVKFLGRVYSSPALQN